MKPKLWLPSFVNAARATMLDLAVTLPGNRNPKPPMKNPLPLLAAIAHDPESVILDEPFSGFDLVNQQVMEEIIRDMHELKEI
jgi:ABC-type transporter Mla maintaining outer membrane lipid asymmetry ATPase subunit MlaF